MFLDKRVVSISLGSGHALALTDQGEVYGWGKNDYKQVCDISDAYIQQPRLIEELKGQNIVGICCGPMQTFVWSHVSCWSPKTSIPFVVDLNENTFKLLDELLEIVCDNFKQLVNNFPLTRDKEIIAISTLNLLHLQVILY